MLLSVIIPTVGNVDALIRTLDSLAYKQGLGERDYEVLVVQDQLAEAAGWERQLVRDAYCGKPRCLHWITASMYGDNGAATARNAGIKLARGRRLLFVDDDCVCPPGLLAVHAERGVGDALIGFRRHVKGWEATRQDAWELSAGHDARWRHLHSIEKDCKANSPHLNCWAYTCHLSVPAHAARAIGGFWEEMKGSGWEDREFALRLQRYGLCFDVLRAPMVSHLDHPQRPSQKDNVTRNRLLFSQTRDNATIVVRNGGPIHDPNGVVEELQRGDQGAEHRSGGEAVV